ncbi:aminotransferase class I/II-fold pyridoxal phosphate-dependent enzyme [Fulvivirga sp. M361]|uniref:bifunctional aminotransferase class I/II-fold pyridoxal phosphate-dependent enzyme/GNAT family N-acetyltransferase n=1 Tax=Fulvivirga sp. M361 TaxID=2594266 RepID=UPI00117BCC8C|nr:bifunctional aminotransferase class I/II-fold pyridoxal phosphate-dependent enzyme/GNAT family N-acetyltransferase [Fulvivirga sp. M361]TRX59551.1 aminotransferase class I/II-fold pyridoxal phosphate-dependent enzyme [Fulvivirga sp. M361]
MAKIRHNNIIDTVDEVFTLAKETGSLHLYADDEPLNGRTLSIQGKRVLHFGTCGYLGLEHHPKIKDGAIKAIQRYGTQFPMSKTYVSNPLYEELESLIEDMYQAPVVISKNCTLSHLATIPTVIRNSDLVILDHQVHTSVQDAVKKLLSRGVVVEMIRHSNLEMLEERVKKQRGKFDKIWYMADGVYSMYGDLAPVKELMALSDKYDELYLYLDDAHGMSWDGKHGTGYVMGQMGTLHHKTILTSTMGKAFGACGGLTLFPNKEWHRKVKTFGGPLTFSVQMEPPILGAAVESAKIHLSPEIVSLQNELQKKISYANSLISNTDLPMISSNVSPIFYIGTGTMAMGNLLIKELIKDGIYINLAPFPGVPAKNTGTRVTVSNSNTLEDIEIMVDKLQYHFDASLREVRLTRTKIWEAFKIEPPKETNKTPEQASELTLDRCESIHDVDEKVWNNFLGHRGMFDWQGLRFLEESFSNNEKTESNWLFRYYTVKNKEGEVILMTFFVIALYKEDMFSEVSISKTMEEKRRTDPYYFTSKAMVMGSLFTEGDHFYINRSSVQWKEAFSLLLDEVYHEQKLHDVKNIILRDYMAQDEEIHRFMLEQSFVKVDMPESCVFEDLNWVGEDGFVDISSKKGKRHYRQKIKQYEEYYDIQVKKSLENDELSQAMKLFQNVKNNNYAINSFDFPDKLFHTMNDESCWEFLMLYLRTEEKEEAKLVAVGFCHINVEQVYSPMLIGMDYDYVFDYGVYRTALYQMVRRANTLGCKRVNFGISASIEKQRIGCELYPKVAYVQAKDNYEAQMMQATIALQND